MFVFYALVLSNSITKQVTFERKVTTIKCNYTEVKEWTKNGLSLPKGIMVGLGIIVIPQTTKEDEGIYACTEYSNEGQKTVFKIDLKVAGRPKLRSTLLNYTITRIKMLYHL